MELEEATRRLNIVSAELEIMEKEVDDQMKKYTDPRWTVESDDSKTVDENCSIEEDVLRMFEEMGKEILRKQNEVETARRIVVSCEADNYTSNWDNNELVLWHYNGYHYLRNKKNYVYWQKSGKWAGIYLESEDRLDETAPEPDYDIEPPPLVLMEHVEWKCNKRMGCLCN